jgi:glycopeptide antibiotics resistance protein
MKNFVYRNVAGLLFAWVMVILALCATPGAYIPSADWLDLLSIDKLIHALMFFVLCILFTISAVKAEKPKFILGVYLVLSVLYGISLEIMQATVFRDRSMDWKDMIANTFGCVMSMFFYRRIKQFVNELKGKNENPI